MPKKKTSDDAIDGPCIFKKGQEGTVVRGGNQPIALATVVEVKKRPKEFQTDNPGYTNWKYFRNGIPISKHSFKDGYYTVRARENGDAERVEIYEKLSSISSRLEYKPGWTRLKGALTDEEVRSLYDLIRRLESRLN